MSRSHTKAKRRKKRRDAELRIRKQNHHERQETPKR